MNIAFDGAEIANVILRAFAPAHFVFGVIMGHFYGKYLVSGQKKYRLISFVVPILYHSITNGLMASMDLSRINLVIGAAASISHIIAGVMTVIVIFFWQKNRTLDVSVMEKQVPNDVC